MSTANDTPKFHAAEFGTFATVRDGGRSHGLDGLRGLGALMVVFFHLSENHLLPSYSVFRNGHLFVLVFFVISGTVIKLSADRMRPFRAGAFMRRRFARIWPLHAAILFFMLSFHAVSWLRSGLPVETYFIGDHSLPSWLASLLLLQSVGIYDSVVWNGPSWSISVEFYTYVVFVCGLLGLRKYANIGFAGLLAVSALVIAWHGGLPELPYRLISLYCYVGFFSGVLLYEAVADAQVGDASPARSIIRQSLLVAGFIGCLTYYHDSSALVLPFLLFTVLMIVEIICGNGFLPGLFSLPVLQFLGAISYSLYLAHIPLLNIFMRLRDGLIGRLGWSSEMISALFVPVYFLVLFAISWLLYKHLEVRARAWLTGRHPRVQPG